MGRPALRRLRWLAPVLASGAPSAAHAALTGRDLWESTRAAATLVPGRRAPTGLLAGIGVHLTVSAGWGLLLALVLPRRHVMAAGAVAGVAIASIDLGTVGRRYPAIRALPVVPQWLDHVAFGALTGWALSDSRDERRPDRWRVSRRG